MFDARAVAARRPFPIWALALGLLLGLNLLVVLGVLLRQERASAVAPAAVAPAAMPAPASVAPPTSATSLPTAASAPAASAPPVAAAPSTATPVNRTAATPRPMTAGTVTRGDDMTGMGATGTALPTATARTRDDLLAAGDAVPEAVLSLHVYDPDPGARFILLNGQRLREGDTTGNGLRVLGIVPDGVVLDHRGNTFKVSIEP